MGGQKRSSTGLDIPRLPGPALSRPALSRPAHVLPFTEFIHELDTFPIDRLSETAASQRLKQSGKNEFDEREGVSARKIIVAQIANAMALVLILTMAVGFGI
jgi:P-type Na+/K+ transporter